MTYPSSLRITATCSPEQASDELLAAILAAVGFDLDPIIPLPGGVESDSKGEAQS